MRSLDWRSGETIFAVFASTILASSAAFSADSKADEKKLADMITSMTPLGKWFDEVQSVDKRWPAQVKPSAVNAKQLQCMRDGLTSAALLKNFADDARVFAAADSETAIAVLNLLRGDAGKRFGSLIDIGLRQMSRRPYSQDEAELKGVNPKEVSAITELLRNPKYQEFRDLIGLRHFLWRSMPDDSPRWIGNLISGRAEGMLNQRVINAAQSCGVPLDAVFPKSELEIVMEYFPPLSAEPSCPSFNRDSPRKIERDAQPPKVSSNFPNRTPTAPKVSQYLKEKGTVVLNLYVTDTGDVRRAEVSKSSGHERLDWTAIDAATDWKFQPGEIGAKPACMWTTVSVDFK